LQVSGDRDILVNASVRRLILCGIIQLRSLSRDNESLTAAHVGVHSTSVILFVQKCNCLHCVGRGKGGPWPPQNFDIRYFCY